MHVAPNEFSFPRVSAMEVGKVTWPTELMGGKLLTLAFLPLFFDILHFCLLRMRKQRVLSVFQSLRSTGPANAARSSKCSMKTVHMGTVHTCTYRLLYLKFIWHCVMNELVLQNISPSSPPHLFSAFKACHPKVKSFYFAADGVDDMNR